MRKPFYISSTSRLKIEQFGVFLKDKGYLLESLSLELPEVQSMDVSQVCEQKIRIASRLTSMRPLMVDDTGIEISGLQGFPGALLKPILQQGQIALLKKLSASAQRDERAEALLVCAVGVNFGNEIVVRKGTLTGLLDFRDSARMGDLDCTRIFFPEGSERSIKHLSEISGPHAFQHRLKAMELVFDDLSNRGAV